MIELKNVCKSYRKRGAEVQALRGVSFYVPAGGLAAIVGPSGSGKTTLMNILGCLDAPDSGEYLLGGAPVGSLRGGRAARLRSTHIGFVFQGFRLIPTLSALENVELPLILRGEPPRTRREKAVRALARVGLSAREGHRPAELSGGQQQRVAIARALVTAPTLVLADEPTGNLDRAAGETVLQLLLEARSEGRTVLLITHDEGVAAHIPRRLQIRNGILTEEVD